MTPSRQRVVDALAHRQPDRVPLDLGATESSGITGIAYHRLREVLGLPPRPPRMFDVYQQVTLIDDDIREALGIDVVALHFQPTKWKAAALPDGSPCEIPDKWNPEAQKDGSQVVRDDGGNIVARMPAGGLYFEPSYAPLAGITEVEQLDEFHEAIESFDWPGFADEGLPVMTQRAKHLHQRSGAAVVLNLQVHLLAAGQILRGYEQFMMDLLAEPALADALLAKLVAAYKRRAARVLGLLGQYVDVVLVNDDLGTQNGPMMSAACYRARLLPAQRELFGFIKQQFTGKLLMHSCGAVREFILDLIDIGVDALNPVQVSAAGMDSAQLKRDFGGQMTFWGGGCDTQRVLRSGSRRDVFDEVKRRIDDFAPGGGFVFTQVHNIQPDVPAENLLAMFEAFSEYR
jgi:uroporphyrinogen decarboxylase